MNKIVKSLALSAGVALVSQAAQAQFVNGDLVLGFTAANAANDYIIELGNFQTVVGVGGSSVVDLSSHFSASSFNSDFSGGLNGVDMGVVGGNNAFNPSSIFETALRSSLGTPALPGSAQPASLPHAAGKNGLSEIPTMVNGLGMAAGQSLSTPRGGTGTGNYSWFNYVPSATPPTQSYFTQTGYNPDSTASGNVIREDLWGTPATTSSGAYNFTYEGFFTLDLSGASPSLTFTPASLAAVPEPASYGLIAGAGLLVVSLRRQFQRKSA